MEKNDLFSETQGDLFDYVGKNPDKIIVVPHIVNDKNAWGAGFVVPLGKLYSESKRRYHTDKYFQCLGRVQYIPCQNHEDINTRERNVIIANMCAQTLGGKRPLFYNALSKCMDDITVTTDRLMTQHKKPTIVEIVCPRFGSALAGGNWDFIKELIHDCWVQNGITVKVFYL